MFKSFERKKPEIDPVSKEILKKMDEIKSTQKELNDLTEIFENSSFQRDYKSPADKVLIEMKKKKISEAAQQIMAICEANGLDPKRFLSPENIQAAGEKEKPEEQEFRQAA